MLIRKICIFPLEEWRLPLFLLFCWWRLVCFFQNKSAITSCFWIVLTTPTQNFEKIHSALMKIYLFFGCSVDEDCSCSSFLLFFLCLGNGFLNAVTHRGKQPFLFTNFCRCLNTKAYLIFVTSAKVRWSNSPNDILPSWKNSPHDK